MTVRVELVEVIGQLRGKPERRIVLYIGGMGAKPLSNDQARVLARDIHLALDELENPPGGTAA